VSILGPIIPPSITMIIYALAYPEINLVGLMIAGVMPGIAIAIAMAAINHFISMRRNYRGVAETLGLADYWRNHVAGAARARVAGLILGGIASGAFTPTEASVVAVFYALAAGRWILPIAASGDAAAILARSALMTASVLMIVAMSAAFAWVLTVSRMPQQMTELIVAANLSPLAFLFAVNVLLLVFGSSSSRFLGCVLVPILAPSRTRSASTICSSASFVIVNLTMGMITPPVGGLLFVTSVVAKVPLTRMVAEIWPFLWAQIGVLALLSLVPQVSTLSAGDIRLPMIASRRYGTASSVSPAHL
jgi:tripartite ATP-independent transporter DctM subunit